MAEWALWYCNHHVPIGERGWNYFLFIYIVMVFPLCGRLNVCTESQVIQTMACVSNTERFSGSSVDVVSWNVKSINHPVKIKKVITDLKQLRADIQLSRRPSMCASIPVQLLVQRKRVCSWLVTIYSSVSGVQADSAERYVFAAGKLHLFQWYSHASMHLIGMIFFLLSAKHVDH